MSEEHSTKSTDQQRKDAKALLDYIDSSGVFGEISTQEEVIQRYEETSGKYDESMDVNDYNGPKETATTLAKLFPSNRENVYLLDIAAGTGLCAKECRKLGFRHMDGLDASQLMLNEARKQNLYDRYICDFWGEKPLDMPDNTYDAVTICGMSTAIMGKLPVSAIEDLIRVIKPGGYVVNTGFHTSFNDDCVSTEDFRRIVKTLEIQGKWKQIEIRQFERFVHGTNGAICVHQVC